MKPKTLKDLNWDYLDFPRNNEKAVSKKELKQEAVKWIKHFKEKYGEKYHRANSFMDFFNIKEKDLK